MIYLYIGGHRIIYHSFIYFRVIIFYLNTIKFTKTLAYNGIFIRKPGGTINLVEHTHSSENLLKDVEILIICLCR